MPFYRKRPVEVHAFQLGKDKPPRWYADAIESGHIQDEGEEIVISTLEGKMRASRGYYVIRGFAGELYGCRGDIFEQTYQQVSR